MNENNSYFLNNLFNQIMEKIKNDSPEKSYTAFLSHLGVESITKKVMEEAFELSTACLDGKDHKNGKEQITNEAADLIYHILVLLAHKNVTLTEVTLELQKRSKHNDLNQLAINKNKIKLKHGK